MVFYKSSCVKFPWCKIRNSWRTGYWFISFNPSVKNLAFRACQTLWLQRHGVTSCYKGHVSFHHTFISSVCGKVDDSNMLKDMFCLMVFLQNWHAHRVTVAVTLRILKAVTINRAINECMEIYSCCCFQ